MIIAPYSFVLDNSGEYWIINHIERRVVDDNYLLPESVGVGYKLPHDKVTLDGSSRKEYINMRTCTFQQLRNFLNYNIDKELSWLPVLDIKGIVQRKPFSFELGTVPNI